jgi:3'(2'), 5'-bisphosphate nucleotidase
MTDTLTDVMVDAAIAASAAICEVYENEIETIEKADGSPVTIADHRAEAIILEHLAPTGIPVLAEESAAAGNIPDLGHKCFVVDPLDGTKEFIKRNGEFTVNIALVEHGRPTLGVVMVPATGKLFIGGNKGAFETDVREGKIGDLTPITVRADKPIHIVASRSHGHPALGPLCEELGVTGDVSVGSSLKFCLVADGRAQLYPRFTPTCEWDTAAGQAVLEAAGGVVLTLDGAPLRYGKSETRFLNKFFVAAADAELGARAAALMRDLVGDL